jgi:multidrug efflux pump subunit AcrA (membrane-fusion protein)
VQVGQRVRTYSVSSRTQMHQAKITRVTREPGGALVEATIATEARNDGARYLMEIVVETGPFLSVPNVSIIEEGSGRIVYVQQAGGEYSPRTIHTGLEGELYTQVLDGLEEGDQVVSIGSFFVDADNKLKSGDSE